MLPDIFKKGRPWFFAIIILAAILRLPALDTYPPSLYSDEVNQGYNAYSLLLTGRDEHGVLWPVSLRSFGDWKPPLPTYIMMPAIFFLGLDAVSVRLPSAILGIISVALTYMLAKQLLPTPNREKLALLSAWCLAVSPWHLHQSRSAMLVMAALVCLQAGTAAFLYGMKKPFFFMIAAIFFDLAIYSYYGMRLIVPLWILVLGVIFFRQWTRFKTWIMMAIIAGIVLLSPLGLAFIKEPNVLFGRAKTVSIFYDQGINLRLWEYSTEDVSLTPILTRFFHNKANLYTTDILKRFFSHLDGAFLFISGDKAPPFQIPNMGVLYLADGIFFLTGFYQLWMQNKRAQLLLVFFLGLSILPAAFTYLTPSHNRTFTAVFPLTVFIAYGLVDLLQKAKIHTLVLTSAVCLLYTCSIGYYLYQFTKVMPRNYADQWLYGLKEVVSFTNRPDMVRKRIIVLPKTNIAYIYFLFYNRFDPELFTKSVVRDLTPDEFGFEHVSGFDRFVSLRNESGNTIEAGKEQIIVGREGEIPPQFVTDRVFYPDGRIAFLISIR